MPQQCSACIVQLSFWTLYSLFYLFIYLLIWGNNGNSCYCLSKNHNENTFRADATGGRTLYGFTDWLDIV